MQDLVGTVESSAAWCPLGVSRGGKGKRSFGAFKKKKKKDRKKQHLGSKEHKWVWQDPGLDDWI
jgi:hypothetical protein